MPAPTKLKVASVNINCPTLRVATTMIVLKTFGKRNAYYGSIIIIFIFPLACFIF